MQGNRTSQCRIKIVNQCMKLALFSVHNIKNQANKEKTVYYIFFTSIDPTKFRVFNQHVIKINKGDPYNIPT